jgi:hypothetical protein
VKRWISFAWQWLLAKVFGVPLISRSAEGVLGQRVHVFGSGPSADRTRLLVQEGESCLACNHAIKWRSTWDVVFVETVGNSSYGLDQIRLLQEVRYGQLVCKNNYPYLPHRSVLKMAALRRFSGLSVLSEYQASPDEVMRDMELVKGQGPFIFPQYASSILTMVLFAVRSGAREILLHGVDALSRTSERSETSTLHATECLAVPFSVLFERVHRQLELSGISIEIVQEGL